MSDNGIDDKLIADHDYDGIQELDNNLPTWWLALFYASIIFAVIYMPAVHMMGMGDLSAEQYEKGRELFLEKACWGCHTVAGVSTSSQAPGPPASRSCTTTLPGFVGAPRASVSPSSAASPRIEKLVSIVWT